MVKVDRSWATSPNAAYQAATRVRVVVESTTYRISSFAARLAALPLRWLPFNTATALALTVTVVGTVGAGVGVGLGNGVGEGVGVGVGDAAGVGVGVGLAVGVGVGVGLGVGAKLATHSSLSGWPSGSVAVFQSSVPAFWSATRTCSGRASLCVAR